jgi:predicted alpha/beta superfamily hydrolase
MRFVGIILAVLGVACSHAASPHKEPIAFSLTQDVGPGNSVFVVGDHPDLGAWDVTHATKLRWTSGNVWVGQIAVQAGTQLHYRYLSRASSTDKWCDATNVVYLTDVSTTNVPAQPAAPYHGKTIYYLSGWAVPNLFYHSGSNWIAAPMTRIGAGRSPNESLFKITGAGEAGELLEFVFNDGQGNWDNPPGGGNYLTNDDVFYVEDGNVFPYQPPPTFSSPQITTQFIDSTAPNIAARNIHIYVPRGYTENSWKRYPVLYLHDGQNVFDPGGPFGSWSADATATREIGQGRMRETILVAIDNDGNNRIPEYQPPTDSYSGTQGRADAYASFVINNVRPYVDTHYRTLNDPANTLVLGSSMGGLVSLYFGREYSTFGKIGVMSPAFWTSPNYVAQVAAGSKKPLRVYLDIGTNEGGSYWDDCLHMYDIHLQQSYVANDDVTFVGGCGQSHNEAAWAARLPGVYEYLLPAREEPALLAQRDYPPTFSVTMLDRVNNRTNFSYTSLFGFVYAIDRSPDFVNWTTVFTSSTESLPWANHTASDTFINSNPHDFWRLRANAP